MIHCIVTWYYDAFILMFSKGEFELYVVVNDEYIGKDMTFHLQSFHYSPTRGMFSYNYSLAHMELTE
jgi:hypothetical protein